MNPTKLALNANVNLFGKMDEWQAEGLARCNILLSDVSIGDQGVTCLCNVTTGKLQHHRFGKSSTLYIPSQQYCMA